MVHVDGAAEMVTFSVVIPRELAERLNRLAEARGCKRAQLARVLLAEGAARHERVQEIAASIDRVEAAVG